MKGYEGCRRMMAKMQNNALFCTFAAPFEGEVQVTLGLPNGFFQMAFFLLGTIDPLTID